MTAKVYQFKPRVRSTKKQPPSVFEKSNGQIFREVQDDVLGEWQSAAVKDQINAYVASKLPDKLKGAPSTRYLDDLNNLSKIEQQLGMKVAIFYPGCTAHNPAGWVSMFHYGKDVLSTPPMITESTSRAFNIVSFILFEKTLKTLGR